MNVKWSLTQNLKDFAAVDIKFQFLTQNFVNAQNEETYLEKPQFLFIIRFELRGL